MKVLLKIYPQRSHLNATFPLSRALRDRGHEVEYVGIPALRGHVNAQGFLYHEDRDDVFAWAERKRDGGTLTFWAAFRVWRRNRDWARALAHRYAVFEPFGRLLKTIRPDLVLVDSPYTFFSLTLLRTGIPFAIVESMMNLERGPDCPPLDTTLVPTGRRLNRVLISLHWRRYFLKQALYGHLGFRVDFDRRLVMRRARDAGADPSRVSLRRYFHIGLRDVPELILSPRELDFPRQPAPNQIYVGPWPPPDREETMGDYSFPRKFEALVAARRRGASLVYCSLGTGAWRYAGAERFLQHLLQATEGAPWNLVLSIGTESDPADFSPLPNAAVFQVVPQLEVLRQADLMITHGGMNSVSECAFHGVPMIVYPGTTQIDQAGNAARVVYHRLGIQGCLRKETARGLRERILHVLHRAEFKARACAMASKLREASGRDAGLDQLLALVAAKRRISGRGVECDGEVIGSKVQDLRASR